MYDTSKWLERIIESCLFPFQLDCCHVLLYQFKAKFETEIGFKEEYDKLLVASINKELLMKVS